MYVKLEELVGSGNFTVYVGDETQGALTAIAITYVMDTCLVAATMLLSTTERVYTGAVEPKSKACHVIFFVDAQKVDQR